MVAASSHNRDQQGQQPSCSSLLNCAQFLPSFFNRKQHVVLRKEIKFSFTQTLSEQHHSPSRACFINTRKNKLKQFPKHVKWAFMRGGLDSALLKSHSNWLA